MGYLCSTNLWHWVVQLLNNQSQQHLRWQCLLSPMVTSLSATRATKNRCNNQLSHVLVSPWLCMFFFTLAKPNAWNPNYKTSKTSCWDSLKNLHPSSTHLDSNNFKTLGSLPIKQIHQPYTQHTNTHTFNAHTLDHTSVTNKWKATVEIRLSAFFFPHVFSTCAFSVLSFFHMCWSVDQHM